MNRLDILNAVNDLVQNRGITAQRQGLQYFGGHSCGGSARLDNGTNFHKRRIPFSACYGGNGEGYLSSRIKMAEVAQCYPYLLRSPFLDQDALFLILHIVCLCILLRSLLVGSLVASVEFPSVFQGKASVYLVFVQEVSQYVALSHLRERGWLFRVE